MSDSTDLKLEKQARKLRHRVVIRDREGGVWISQIYQNAFTGADALAKMIDVLNSAKEDASESRAISILGKMMIHGYFSRVNGSRRFRPKQGALYRFKWDDPTYSSTRTASSDLEWEFPKHVKANSFILGTALGDWLENSLAKGNARDIQRAIIAIRQKVLDVGRFNGNFMKSDARFKGCEWKTVKTDAKSNIIVQELHGPAIDGADYSTVRVSGFLQQPAEVAAKKLLDPKIRETYGEMMKKDCKYVDVLEKVRTRIRRSRKRRGQSCDSIDELEEETAIESIPTLRGLSDFGSQIGGRFFSNVDLQNVVIGKSSDDSDEENEEEKNNSECIEKPKAHRLASDDTAYYSVSSGEDQNEEDLSKFRLDSSSKKRKNNTTSSSQSEKTISRSKTWQEAAGRKDGREGYMFGDLGRAMIKKAGSYTDDLQHVLEKPTCVFDRFFSSFHSSTLHSTLLIF